MYNVLFFFKDLFPFNYLYASIYDNFHILYSDILFKKKLIFLAFIFQLVFS